MKNPFFSFVWAFLDFSEAYVFAKMSNFPSLYSFEN